MKRIFIFISCLLISFSVYATPYKQVIFFGDSLSDNGNMYRIDMHTMPKSPPYYQGRFSNGPTWAEHLGQYFQSRDNASYKIYALGGAAVLFQSFKESLINPSTLNMQISQYLLSAPTNKNDILYVIWIGGNDYLFDKTSDEDKLTTKVITTLSDDITRLVQSGAKHFLVLNLPDLSLTPIIQHGHSIKHLATLSKLHNDKLSDAIKHFQTSVPGIDISLFRIDTLFSEALGNPEKFNRQYGTHVTDTRHACWQGGFTLSPEELKDSKVCDDPDAYAFWDEIHPTAVIHKVLATIITESLSASA